MPTSGYVVKKKQLHFSSMQSLGLGSGGPQLRRHSRIQVPDSRSASTAVSRSSERGCFSSRQDLLLTLSLQSERIGPPNPQDPEGSRHSSAATQTPGKVRRGKIQITLRFQEGAGRETFNDSDTLCVACRECLGEPVPAIGAGSFEPKALHRLHLLTLCKPTIKHITKYSLLKHPLVSLTRTRSARGISSSVCVRWRMWANLLQQSS